MITSQSAHKERPLGVALIGAGMVAKTHMAAIVEASSNGNVHLCGILERSGKNAPALLSSAPADIQQSARLYPSFDDVLVDPDVDAAILVTPPNARIALTEALAKQGKHILMEKPIARNEQEARQVVEACEAAGVTLSVVFQHRFRAASLAAKSLIESGAPGQLGLVEISVPWWRPQSYYDEPGRGTYERDGGGVLISQAIHTIDLALHLAGPIQSVQAMTAKTDFHQMEAEDFAVAGLRFTDGAHGSLVASTASFPGDAETIVLHFSHASLRLNSGVLTVNWRDGRVETFGEQGGTGGGADPMAFTHEWHLGVLEDFAEAIRCNRPPAITGRDGLRAHRLINAIESSARDGRILEVVQ